MKQIDFLTVGHISKDIVPGGFRTGGTAVFSSRTAQMLGCQTAVLTSTDAKYDLTRALPDIDVHRTISSETTTFENVYTSKGRVQTLHAVANLLTADDIPDDWRRASIVHLAPIANEVDPDMISAFSNSIVGLTLQGWLRRWDHTGKVEACEWPEAERILPLAAAVILSQEDLPHPELVDQLRQWSRLLVLTQAEKGCLVYFGDEVRRVPAPQVTEVEPTGAGDIFAAAFLIRLHQTAGNPWEAARYANEIAAQSVTQEGTRAKLARILEFRAEFC